MKHILERRNLILSGKLLTGFLALWLCLAACSSDNDDPVDPENPENPSGPDNPQPGQGLTEQQADDCMAELMARCMVVACAPDAECNDADKIFNLLEALAEQQMRTTRGVWGQAKAAVDFFKVLNDANKLHRVTIIGSMAKLGLTDQASRQKIYEDIMNSKENPLPSSKKNLSCDEFWKQYSSGELDLYAKEIYKAVLDELVTSESTATEKLADYLVDSNKRPIDLTLQVAGPLIEAGANLVFAFGDDIIQTGKTAYDFIELNGKVVLQACDGNLTAETFIDACNNNLKLLSKGIEEIVPTSQDLFELLSDLSAEQIKQLNQEIEKTIREAGNTTLSPSDVAFFVDKVKDILKIEWTVDFAGLEFVNSSDSSFISFEKEEGKAYTFYYQSKNENILLEGKCAINPDHIALRVDYAEDGCDLLPKAGVPEAGIIIMPYMAQSYSGNGTETIALWWKSEEGRLKFFDLREEKPKLDIKLVRMGGTGYLSDDYRSHIGGSYQNSGAAVWMFDPEYDDFWSHYTLKSHKITKLGKSIKIEASSSYRSSPGGTAYYTLHEADVELDLEYDETQKSKTNMLGKIRSLNYKGVNTTFRSYRDTWIEEGKENIELHFDDLEPTSRTYWSTQYVVDFKNGKKPSYWTCEDAKDTYFYRDNDDNSFYVQIEFK
ncbi:MAG: hypothetical protein IJR87_06415 [Bacteroidaceae bacterium]|nr:hypothetical protein [Bacteroidaceae bacterium]